MGPPPVPDIVPSTAPPTSGAYTRALAARAIFLEQERAATITLDNASVAPGTYNKALDLCLMTGVRSSRLDNPNTRMQRHSHRSPLRDHTGYAQVCNRKATSER